MPRRLLPIVLFLFGAAAASGESARLPLDPAALAGAEVFTAAEAQVAAAAQAAGLAFAPDPRPLPPQVLLTLDTLDGRVQRHQGLLYWRGEMLPDQLAPGETGTLVRRCRTKTGAWKTVRTQDGVGPATRTDLLPTARSARFSSGLSVLDFVKRTVAGRGNARFGLGHLLHYGRELQAMDQVLGVIFVIIALGLLVDRLVFSPIESFLHERWGTK